MAARRIRMIGALSALALVVGVGCSDDDEETSTDTTEASGDEATDDTAAPDDEEATDDTAAPEEEGEEAAGDLIEVTALDYAFEGLPEVIAAGSTLSLTTDGGGEPHEIAVFARPDGEERPIEELLALSEEEAGQVLGAPAVVIIALPGTTDTPGVVTGDATFAEPGDYLFVCTFPQGTTVEDVENSQGPLPIDNTPHFALGMAGEFTVE